MSERLRIIHLEDEPLDSELAGEFLLRGGVKADIERVGDLNAFRAALMKGGRALVLSDYTLPGVNPVEALRMAQELRPDVPFMFLSGTIGEEAAIEALKQGACDYVLKHNIARLAPAVRRALDEAAERTARRTAEQELIRARDDLAVANLRLEQIVEERTARLRETIEELEAFSYTLSHDMRTPLRAIEGFSSLLLEEHGAKLPAEGRDFLDRIIRATQRLETMIRDVLSYSRVSHEQLALKPIDLNALAQQLLRENQSFQPPAAEVNLEQPLLAVIGHEASVTQCLGNLLNNAVKYAVPGQTPRIRIWTELRRGQDPVANGQAGSDRVRVWVEDNGIGIPREAQRRLFGLFQRAHAGYEGTGLGLSIVRKAAERMGGQVGFESVEGKGSRFWFELAAATCSQ